MVPLKKKNQKKPRNQVPARKKKKKIKHIFRCVLAVEGGCDSHGKWTDSVSNKKWLCFSPPLLPLSLFMCCISYNLIFFSPANTGFRFPSMGLRFERSNGNSLRWEGAKGTGAAGGEGTRGCFHWGVKAHRGTGLNPALCSALGTFFIQCLLSRAECDDAWRAGVCSHAGRGDPGGSHHPKATPDHKTDPQEGQSWVCW